MQARNNTEARGAAGSRAAVARGWLGGVAAGLALCGWSQPAAAEPILDEPFAYADGALTTVSGGVWANHSGTAGQQDVSGGQLNVTGSEAEDCSRALGATYTSGSLYYGFDLTLTALPGTAQNQYFLHFKDNGSNFRGRAFAKSSGDGFVLGISDVAETTAPPIWDTTVLSLNRGYRVVVRDNLDTDTAQLWVDPADETSTSISSTGSSTASAVALAIRQASGIGTMTLDNLKVGLTFADVNGATVILPEPTNYPTAFAATPGPGSLKLTWTDAVGGQLPQRYLVRVASGALPPLPVDGTPVADDADGSDGLAARNVAYGVRTVTFAGLAAGTSYTCVIYPACNAGAAIDYKTDGAVPWVSAVPLRAPAVIAAESFESGGFGAWTAYSVSSSNNWKVVAGAGVGSGVYFAEVNGFAQTEPSHDWLISPPLDLAKALAASLRFWTQWKYGNNDASNYLKVRVSTDYAGAGDPTPAAWSELPFAIGAADAWTAGGELDLAAYLGKTVYVAFQYYSADTPRRWRVDGIEVSAMLEDKPGTVIILR